MEVAPFFVDFHHFLSIFTIFYRFSRFTHVCRDLHFVAIFFGQNSLLRNITRFLQVCSSSLFDPSNHPYAVCLFLCACNLCFSFCSLCYLGNLCFWFDLSATYIKTLSAFWFVSDFCTLFCNVAAIVPIILNVHYLFSGSTKQSGPTSSWDPKFGRLTRPLIYVCLYMNKYENYH